MYLTKSEVESLEDGTNVEVIWSGGNGPHVYEIGTDKWGTKRIGRDSVEGSFVGTEHMHTRVRLAPENLKCS